MALTVTKAVAAPAAADIRKAYQAAKARYAKLGIDTDRAVQTALRIPISVHCWQADDVKGLEVPAEKGPVDGGGILATGGYPGAARSGDEIRADFDTAAPLIPGAKRFNLHSIYAETGGRRVSRDALKPAHFAKWIDWARRRRYGLDYNPSFFAHPMLKDGLSLSSPEKRVREFWIRHGISSRVISAAIAARLGSCTHNLWIPDGRKDSTVDRLGPRRRLRESLDRIFTRSYRGVADVVESKLFGIGVEDYTVGSLEFYLLYAQEKKLGVCLDMGHFHPTESAADKLSAAGLFLDLILLHVSRGIRWDSDHVVKTGDELQAVCDQAVWGGLLGKIVWATDYFDASINRLGAWAIGARALRKGLLAALLAPAALLTQTENAMKGAAKLALLEYRNELPLGAAWDYLCLKAGAPAGASWVETMEKYEAAVQLKRR